MASQCRLRPEELVAYLDGTLPVGRREIIEAHLVACRSCQERLATFREVDTIIQEQALTPDTSMWRRTRLRDRLQQEAIRPTNRRLFSQLSLNRAVTLLVPLLLLLVLLPAVGRAGFPLSHFVRFAEVEITEKLSPDEQEAIRHVAPSGSDVSGPSFPVVAPPELPFGLALVEQSTPDDERVELLYRNDSGVALLVTQLPAKDGLVTLERDGTEVATVRDTDVLIVRDPRPGAVAAFTWERDGVFFDVLVIEAPTGGYGGFKRADALQVVEALMEAQDGAQG